jgi:hypothetical protein
MSDKKVTIEQRIAALEKRVEFLEKERPGRRMKPNVASTPGICGVDPSQDSKECPNASIYRHQQGCLGESCVQINREYYSTYRAKNKKISEAVVES